jgi:hypothetical protein
MFRGNQLFQSSGQKSKPGGEIGTLTGRRLVGHRQDDCVQGQETVVVRSIVDEGIQGK